MRVVVVSDTHDNLDAIDAFLKEIKDIDYSALIHAGDIISPFALKKFAGIKYFGVFGNNDGERSLLAKVARENNMVLEDQPLFIELENYKIAVIHGVDGAEKTETLVNALARSGLFSLVVYGHLHKIDVKKIGETLVVNPGTLSGYLADRRTYALVDLEEKIVEIREL